MVGDVLRSLTYCEGVEERARYVEAVKRWEESKTRERLERQEAMRANGHPPLVVEYAPVGPIPSRRSSTEIRRDRSNCRIRLC